LVGGGLEMGGKVLGELIGRESRDQREIGERLAVGEWDPLSFPFLSSFFHFQNSDPPSCRCVRFFFEKKYTVYVRDAVRSSSILTFLIFFTIQIMD
jgi:hypothetical protein